MVWYLELLLRFEPGTPGSLGGLPGSFSLPRIFIFIRGPQFFFYPIEFCHHHPPGTESAVACAPEVCYLGAQYEVHATPYVSRHEDGPGNGKEGRRRVEERY